MNVPRARRFPYRPIVAPRSPLRLAVPTVYTGTLTTLTASATSTSYWVRPA